MSRTLAILILSGLALPPTFAQAVPDKAPIQPAPAPAKFEDVKSIDAIVAALYGSISGGKDQPRDWDRMRSLFAPEARLVPIAKRGDKAAPILMSVEDYIQRAGPMLVREGFTEKEVARRVERFHHLAHVWSTYEGRLASDPDKVYVSGINSIQLLWDEERWWVLNVTWSAATDAVPVPEPYKN